MKLAAFIFGAAALVVDMYGRKYMEDDKQATLVELEKDHGFPRIKTYDFIVVGGGTAGCLVAGRLSEKFNVLLLEAGGTPTPHSHSPMFIRDVTMDPFTNYFYKSVPQKNLSLSTGGRGNPQDWDNFAALVNDPSWRYENILEFFKKSENFVGQLIQPEQAEYYGYGGPLTVDTHFPAILPKWFEAGEELGFPAGDPNALQKESFTPAEKMIEKGGRVSTYTGFVRPFEGTRANLTVVRYAIVTEVIVDKANRAYGVAYLRHNIPQIAHVSKEVILSAGSFNSPLILMMSGIGPTDVLEEANIPVKVSSPQVGRNLVDHVFILLHDFVFNASAIPYLPKVKEDDFEATMKEYLETGGGYFGELQEGPQAFFVSSRAKAAGETTWPDGRIAVSFACPMSYDDDIMSSTCFFAQVERPQSRGFVTLNISAYTSGSRDFVELAEIDFNSFSVASDMDVIIEGIELILKVVEDTKTFQSFGGRYMGTPIPACVQFPFRSREYWSCYIQQRGMSAIHMVGTCGMGSNPFTSVTDSKLKVRGVTGLRVVDASVLPATPNANLNGPVILVAEKASHEITQEWS